MRQLIAAKRRHGPETDSTPSLLTLIKLGHFRLWGEHHKDRRVLLWRIGGIDFDVGYQWRRDTSNLLLAIKKALIL